MSGPRIRRALAILLLLLPVLAVAKGKPKGKTKAGPPLQISIRGNRVLLDPVLLREMKLPDSGPATPKLAGLVEQRLQRYLRETGYSLALVRAYEYDGQLVVLVDEGRLDKIVFIGTGDWKTLNLRLEFELPGQVYNNYQVKAELDRLTDKYGYKALKAEVVEIRPTKPTVFQLERLVRSRKWKAAQNFWLRQRGRYELRITVVSEAWGTGLGYGLRYRDPYGLTAHVQYSGDDLIFSRDRHRSMISASAWTQESLLSGDTDFTLTHARLGLEWATPALIGNWFRSSVGLRGDVLNLQRGDLGVDQYWRFMASAALNLGFEPVEQLSFSVGVGYAFEALIGMETTADSVVPDKYDPRNLPFFQARIDLLLEKPHLRRDKRHRLRLFYRDYNFWQQDHVDRVSLRFTKCFEFGYEELYLRARGAMVWGGKVLWPDEASLTSDTMRAVAGDSRYARKVGQGGLEFRLSLHRDLVKIGLFAEAGVFGEIQRPTIDPADPVSMAQRSNRSPSDEELAFQLAVGPGVHFLILDTFQIDLYYGFGFYFPLEKGPNRKWDYTGSVNFSFQKVY